ncbi:hypothetical protein PQE75_gp045 [Bacillus phage vB_BcoS-136]|uniref:Uncharacterized protein n=1 Tax=Bacillus phage vB_BcoS-136 TaxID=2419619 RepID=A0A3G3BVA8_9CAUD|nr:hypothetical protein PQE75_gp045 [Bacillus phage vB_BcoS-136]AYP68177.1 hypothetical protein vBBcoS136_00045 [Bacillus phage vB_BcoS-136]
MKTVKFTCDNTLIEVPSDWLDKTFKGIAESELITNPYGYGSDEEYVKGRVELLHDNIDAWADILLMNADEGGVIVSQVSL